MYVYRIFYPIYNSLCTIHVTILQILFDYVKMYATFGGGVAAATTKRVVSPQVITSSDKAIGAAH